MLEARNDFGRDFAGQRVVLAVSEPISAFTCDRQSHLAGVLNGRTGAGWDPCFSVSVPFQNRLVLVVGASEEEDEMQKILSLCSFERAREELARTRDSWNRIVRKLTVKTPERELDRYLNGWALYQVVACRLLARCSLYQCGGAYGFRDQLQDVCALMGTSPKRAREQILRACSRQYEQGVSSTGGTRRAPPAPEKECGPGTATICSGFPMPFASISRKRATRRFWRGWGRISNLSRSGRGTGAL